MTAAAGPETVISVPVPGSGEYEVRVQAGALGGLGGLCAESVPAHHYALVADSRVAELYGGKVLAAFRDAGLSAELAPFPAGEWNKTRETWAAVTDRILHSGLGRDGAVVALGGGVTGDLAGFVAATYMRGVPLVHVPTTLLAMVDSAVGGKVGVDTEAGKNLVGAFHHPALVVIDPELLDTLPRVHRASGLAEVVKTAAIADEGFFAWLEEHAEGVLAGESDPSWHAIVRSVRHKAKVVAADPGETGRRATLNFGHTIGHALELLCGYEILHGEAVAAGMRVEARLGERLGVTEAGAAARLTELLDACGLDRRLEDERSRRSVWEAALHDKKARGGRPRCVLLRRIGEVARTEQGAWTFPFPSDGNPDASGAGSGSALLEEAPR